jgi:hypothetical protein
MLYVHVIEGIENPQNNKQNLIHSFQIFLLKSLIPMTIFTFIALLVIMFVIIPFGHMQNDGAFAFQEYCLGFVEGLRPLVIFLGGVVGVIITAFSIKLFLDSF